MNKLAKYADDILVLSGIIVLLANTYYINWLIANYMLSVILILMGFLFAKRK